MGKFDMKKLFVTASTFAIVAGTGMGLLPAPQAAAQENYDPNFMQNIYQQSGAVSISVREALVKQSPSPLEKPVVQALRDIASTEMGKQMVQTLAESNYTIEVRSPDAEITLLNPIQKKISLPNWSNKSIGATTMLLLHEGNHAWLVSKGVQTATSDTSFSPQDLLLINKFSEAACDVRTLESAYDLMLKGKPDALNALLGQYKKAGMVRRYIQTRQEIDASVQNTKRQPKAEFQKNKTAFAKYMAFRAGVAGWLTSDDPAFYENMYLNQYETALNKKGAALSAVKNPITINTRLSNGVTLLDRMVQASNGRFSPQEILDMFGRLTPQTMQRLAKINARIQNLRQPKSYLPTIGY